MKQLLHVPNIILSAIDDDGEYAGDDADDNYDGDTNCDYNQSYVKVAEDLKHLCFFL